MRKSETFFATSILREINSELRISKIAISYISKIHFDTILPFFIADFLSKWKT